MSNPLVDRILGNPLTFVAPKHADRDVHTEKPASYIVLTKSKQKTVAAPVKKKAAKVKSHSMAEAIAKYTGRYMTKAERRKLPAPESESSDTQYESASEFQTDSSFQGFRSSSEDRESDEGNTKSDNEDVGTAVQENEGENEIESQSESKGASKSESDSQSESESESGSASESESEGSNNIKQSDNVKDSDNGRGSDNDRGSDNVEVNVRDAVKGAKANTSTIKDLDIIETDDEDGDYDEKVDSDDEDDEDEDEDEDEGDESDDSDDDDNDNVMPPELVRTLKHDLLNDRKTPPTSPEEDTLQEHNRIVKAWYPGERNKRPVGLLNFGVTCYMNSAIQVMLHIPAVQHYLLEVQAGKHSELKPRSVTHTLAELLAKMWSSSKYVNPKKIVQRLDDINCMMSEWQQEDSHEYFMSLMARLQEDSTPKGHKLNESVIYDVFGGVLDQEVVCQACGTVSKTKQELYDVSLGLHRKKRADLDSVRYTVDKSMSDFFGTETIRIDKNDPSSGYYCEKCKTRTVATKRSTLAQSPQTLMVHLKRFKFNGNSLAKVKQAIGYSKYLDLTPYTTDKHVSKYQLMAVIVHEGRSILSGHYVAHCLQPDGTWSTYDDEYINRIDERLALSDPSAYCLVYTRVTGKRTGEGEDDRSVKRTKVA